MANLFDHLLNPPMSVQEANYIRGAINTYCRGLKASDEKDVLQMWIREFDKYMNTKAVVSDTDKPF